MVTDTQPFPQFLSSRPSTPFLPKSSGLSPLRQEVHAAPQSNGDVQQSSVVANLEKQVEGQAEGALNGHAPP